jgi:polyhydroxybutyrate depolymerase
VKTSVKITLAISAVLLIGLGLQSATVAPPIKQPEKRDLLYTIHFDGMARTYRVHVPLKYTGKTKVPIVMMLHGLGGNSKNGLEQGKWIEKSEQEGFLAVGLDGTLKYPGRREGLLSNPRSWNSGGLTGGGGSTANDVGYVNAVIDRMEAEFAVDPNRIYLTGFSNGAAMAFRVGAALSHRIAAIAPVANALLVKVDRLQRPVSLLLIWGTADPINPIEGGKIQRSGQTTLRPSAHDSWLTWGKLLGCQLQPQTIYNQNGVVGRSFPHCNANSEAIFYTVEGMGHHWPGGRAFLPASVIGKPSQAIDATDLIWQFFQTHPQQ